MLPTFFISPKKPGKLIWGVGPVFQLPTATNTYLGQGKLGLGPSIVVLTQPGNWTLGVLANNVWSVAGSGSRPDVNQFLLQYFINYNLKKGWYITWQPTLTANWEAPSGSQWVVPFGGGVGRIMKLGFQPVSLTAQLFGNAVHPAGTPAWTMRLQIAFLFPKLTKDQQEMILEKKLKQLQEQPPPPMPHPPGHRGPPTATSPRRSLEPIPPLRTGRGHRAFNFLCVRHTQHIAVRVLKPSDMHGSSGSGPDAEFVLTQVFIPIESHAFSPQGFYSRYHIRHVEAEYCVLMRCESGHDRDP
jgi:hypothetical protein